MSESTEQPNPQAHAAREAESRAARRRLLKGGLGAAPVLMTLASRPVLGASCTTPSGFVSLTASGHADLQCFGRTPGFWKQDQFFRNWPPPYFPTTVTGPGGHSATQFHPLFAGAAYQGKTLLDVLNLGGGPPDDVGRHIVAALLNAATNLTPTLTVQNVKDIWSEFTTKGFFEPTAGVHWDHTQIVTYLLTTMPV